MAWYNWRWGKGGDSVKTGVQNPMPSTPTIVEDFDQTIKLLKAGLITLIMMASMPMSPP